MWFTPEYHHFICSGSAYPSAPSSVKMALNAGTLMTLRLDKLCKREVEKELMSTSWEAPKFWLLFCLESQQTIRFQNFKYSISENLLLQMSSFPILHLNLCFASFGLLLYKMFHAQFPFLMFSFTEINVFPWKKFNLAHFMTKRCVSLDL